MIANRRVGEGKGNRPAGLTPSPRHTIEGPRLHRPLIPSAPVQLPSPSLRGPSSHLLEEERHGDERQRGLEAAVQAKLDEAGLPIRVSHLPTGWSGNWSHTLERALAEAERHQALVLIRFMRTWFGRSLRKGIRCPWVTCPGVGVGQVVRRVRKVAGLVGGG